jgi:hypothetical protein
VIRASDIVRAIVAPLTEPSMLLFLLLFGGLLTLGLDRLPLGVLIVILSLPPMFRYISFVVEASASGKVPGAFDAEYFSWVGTGWTMFPLLLAVILGYMGLRATEAWGAAGMWAAIIVSAAIVPASLAVLAITHSALQAMNPVALIKVFKQAGAQFLLAPVYVLLLTTLTLMSGWLPLWAMVFVGVFVMLSVASLTGALIAPFRLVDNLYIPEALEPDQNRSTAELLQLRESVLAHAYGFISRNNREGGFRHLFCAIEEDPDPAAAWDWYLKSMFRWENKVHALFFAQHYIRDALAHKEDIRAVKAALRCYRENEQFRPFRDNVAALIEVAERTGNAELAEVLKRG